MPAPSRGAVTRTGVLVTALACAAGCGSPRPDAGTATRAAESFHAAVAGGDGAGACALLAPATAAELAETAGAPCEQAVLDAGLPRTSGASDATAAGRQAQVVLDGDTLFLTVSGTDWLVTAAGCTPRPERPYDCTVSAG